MSAERMVCALTAVVVVGAACCARAGVTNIVSGGPLYTGIMQAVTLATDQDVLLISTGVYRESVELPKSLTLLGGYRPDFSLTAGYTEITAPGGPGIAAYRSSTTCIANIEVRNSTDSGIMIYEESLMTLSNCTVRNNRGRSGGGGLDVRHASRVAAYNSRIYANAATNSGGGGARLRDGSVLEVCDGTSGIYGNFAPVGGGAMLEDGSMLLVRRQATVYLNTAVTRGGGVYATTGARVECNAYGSIGWGSLNFNRVTNGCGAGVYADAGAVIVVTNQGRIGGNHASHDGGGVFLSNATLQVVDNGYMGLIMGNYLCTNAALGSGGGVYAVGSTVLVLRSSTLSGGRAGGDGGGIYADRSFVQLADNVVLGNVVTANANYAQGGDGGGIHARRSTVVISNATLLNNVAAGSDGGGLLARQASTVMAVNVVLQGNVAATNGGGMALVSSVAEISGAFAAPVSTPPCRYINNSAQYGGAVHLRGSRCALADALIVSNTAAGSGGAFLVLESAHARMVNAVIAHNRAGVAGVGSIAYSSDAALLHCTLAHNGATGVVASFSGSVIATNTIVWGHTTLNLMAGQAAGYCDIAGGYPGAGNLNADPQFADAIALDYALQAGSPCIDTGTVIGVTHDCLGEPRPYGSAPDLGAYEYVPEPGLAGLIGIFAIYNVRCTIWRKQRRGRGQE